MKLPRKLGKEPLIEAIFEVRFTAALPVSISFYSKLLTEQERLGTEFEKILFDNIWDLYAR